MMTYSAYTWLDFEKIGLENNGEISCLSDRWKVTV